MRSRRATFAMAVLLPLVLGAGPSPADAGRKALLIGAGAYPYLPDYAQLDGPRNDVRAMNTFLVREWGFSLVRHPRPRRRRGDQAGHARRPSRVAAGRHRARRPGRHLLLRPRLARARRERRRARRDGRDVHAHRFRPRWPSCRGHADRRRAGRRPGADERSPGPADCGLLPLGNRDSILPARSLRRRTEHEAAVLSLPAGIGSVAQHRRRARRGAHRGGHRHPPHALRRAALPARLGNGRRGNLHQVLHRGADRHARRSERQRSRDQRRAHQLRQAEDRALVAGRRSRAGTRGLQFTPNFDPKNETFVLLPVASGDDSPTVAEEDGGGCLGHPARAGGRCDRHRDRAGESPPDR